MDFIANYKNLLETAGHNLSSFYRDFVFVYKTTQVLVKTQLLNAPILANQNNNKNARNYSTLMALQFWINLHFSAWWLVNRTWNKYGRFVEDKFGTFHLEFGSFQGSFELFAKLPWLFPHLSSVPRIHDCEHHSFWALYRILHWDVRKQQGSTHGP